ncbi:MAG: DUF2249 domain-containing protein [Chloroflexi bacterium]|nr:DUF2249 domain-containing protein [Chloroflexota bacterium]
MDQEPILASWTIHEVLARYPELLETLIALSPAFSKLRNPLLRRVQSRLVTVAQAAQLAGLEPAALVRQLNAAVGGNTAPLEADASGPAGAAAELPPAAFADAPIVATVDARPLLDRGEEPFGAIMAAAARVGVGEALLLRNSFEPLPLYDVLGQRGFRHQTRQLAPDDWEVRFVRVAAPGRAPAMPEAGASAPVPVAPAQQAPAAVVTIDVSDLVPPEPMVRILGALEALAPGQTLLVHHVRRPVYLYPQLDALGYRHETRDREGGGVEIWIHKPPVGEARR